MMLYSVSFPIRKIHMDYIVYCTHSYSTIMTEAIIMILHNVTFPIRKCTLLIVVHETITLYCNVHLCA